MSTLAQPLEDAAGPTPPRRGGVVGRALDAALDPAAARLWGWVGPLLVTVVAGVLRFVASSELGSGTLSNPVVPEHAARALRDA